MTGLVSLECTKLPLYFGVIGAHGCSRLWLADSVALYFVCLWVIQDPNFDKITLFFSLNYLSVGNLMPFFHILRYHFKTQTNMYKNRSENETVTKIVETGLKFVTLTLLSESDS